MLDVQRSTLTSLSIQYRVLFFSLYYFVVFNCLHLSGSLRDTLRLDLFFSIAFNEGYHQTVIIIKA